MKNLTRPNYFIIKSFRHTMQRRRGNRCYSLRGLFFLCDILAAELVSMVANNLIDRNY